MSADPLIYCLQQLTDYRQFERLCTDIMAGVGYEDIDPLGGPSDRGRDALHVVRREPADITVFAFSVRSDWRRKLMQDCDRVREEQHTLQRLVFVSTSSITATEKDEAKGAVRETYGWDLEIYDMERLRVLLTTSARHLVAQHSSIFSPPWFPTRGGLSLAESRDTLVIDHVAADHALASWLGRRLQVAGFPTWCYGTAPLAGEDADASVRLLVERRASRYLPILSSAALADADLVARCGVACNVEGLTIPCWSEEVDHNLLSSSLKDLTPVRFDQSWRTGIRNTLDALAAQGVRPSFDDEQARAIALRSYVPEPVIRPLPERVFGNVFRCNVPDGVQVVALNRELTDGEVQELRRTWAFIQVDPTKLLAFDDPPTSVPAVRARRRPEYAWDSFDAIEGIPTTNVIKQLIVRSLDTACCAADLHWCGDRCLYYFPHGGKVQRNVSYRHIDGRNTWVGVTGERTYGRGERSSPFRYQLSPSFRAGQDESGHWWVTARIYVRVTDRAGVPFAHKDVGRRRKAVTKNWWNKEWFARLLAVMQALSHGTEEIRVGALPRCVSVSTSPLEWACPMSIDVEAVDRVGDFQEEMAALRYADEEGEDDEQADDGAKTDD